MLSSLLYSLHFIIVCLSGLALVSYSGASVAQDAVFSYRFSGDQRLSPERVFDDGKNIYLKYKLDHPIPTISESTAQGDKALSHIVSDNFVVISAMPELISLKSVNGQMATIERFAKQATVSTATALNIDPISKPTYSTMHDTSSSVTTARGFDIRRDDLTLRASLTRWASDDGWVFMPEHWAVAVDIPVSAEAHFSGDFKTAVRSLFAATELTPVPLQPCFYTNKVLRVIPYAQRCDRGRRES